MGVKLGLQTRNPNEIPTSFLAHIEYYYSMDNVKTRPKPDSCNSLYDHTLSLTCELIVNVMHEFISYIKHLANHGVRSGHKPITIFIIY